MQDNEFWKTKEIDIAIEQIKQLYSLKYISFEKMNTIVNLFKTEC